MAISPEHSKICEIESLLSYAIEYLDEGKQAQAAANIGRVFELLGRINEKEDAETEKN
jgi:hypothetical protein